MPQASLNYVAKNTGNALAPMLLDAQGALQNSAGGISSKLNVSAATVIKNKPGRCVTVNVLVAGAVGSISDCAAVADVAAANKVAVVPAVVGTYRLDFPCAVGIVYTPGASQVVSISYT